MMPHPNVVQDFLLLAFIVILVALAFAHLDKRAGHIVQASESNLCNIAKRDACDQYRINIAYGYSARAARANVRAMLHEKYNLKGSIARAVLHDALAKARATTERDAHSNNVASIIKRTYL